MTDTQRRVVVVGAVNVDHIYRVRELPGPGETVQGATYFRAGGGKAANMAVSAAANGCDAHLVAAVGEDPDGELAIAELTKFGVNAGHIGRVAGPTGRAAILSSPDDNLIAVAPGANDQLDPDSVAASVGECAGAPGGVCLLSAEASDEVVTAAAFAARERHVELVYNVAPARAVAPALTTDKLTVVVNEHESETLTGEQDPVVAARSIQKEYGVGIVTLGERGVVVSSIDGLGEFSANTVEVADTTGAGDAFCGALAAVLATTQNLSAAVEAGIEAGGKAAGHVGARTWVRAVPR